MKIIDLYLGWFKTHIEALRNSDTIQVYDCIALPTYNPCTQMKTYDHSNIPTHLLHSCPRIQGLRASRRSRQLYGIIPLLLSVTDIHWGINPQQQPFVRYKSVELFRFLGVFAYHNPLDVVMTLTQPDQQIVSDVQTNQNVTVQFIFDLTEKSGITTITETITTHMPALLSRFVIGQAKSVQQNRAKVLTQRMQSLNQKGE